MTSLRTVIRGAEIAHEQSGVGPDLIWGHGLTQTRAIENARGLVDWSAVGAAVVRYDARGHGETTTSIEAGVEQLDGFTWEALAHDQLALADARGIDSYISGGASMGCATALHAAVLAPARINALVLVIPPTAWETRAAQVATYEQGAKAVEAYGIEALIKASAAVPPADPFLDDLDHRRLQAEAMRTWDPARLARVMRGAGGADLPDRELIAHIDCPTLILAWTGDAGHPTSTADELATLIPHSELHVASTSTELAAWTGLIADFVSSPE